MQSRKGRKRRPGVHMNGSSASPTADFSEDADMGGGMGVRAEGSVGIGGGVVEKNGELEGGERMQISNGGIQGINGFGWHGERWVADLEGNATVSAIEESRLNIEECTEHIDTSNVCTDVKMGEAGDDHCNLAADENACLASHDIGKESGFLEENKFGQVEDKKCNYDSAAFENQINEDGFGTANVEEPNPKKKRRISEKIKVNPDTPLRRSARRAALAENAAFNADNSCPDTALRPLECSNIISNEFELKLPPSSKNLNLDGLLVMDVFSVYSCIRSFSTLLFLSPFTLENFVAALQCGSVSSLIDCLHVSVLQALKVHLEHLSEEGVQSASNCLRGLNWDLLDMITWPVFLAEYLLLHCSSMKPCFNFAHLRLLGGEYYEQPASVKLEILRCLCDDVMEADLIRSELKRRVRETAPNLDNDQSLPFESRLIYSTTNDQPSSPSQDADGEVADTNSDECHLCKMDGNLICCDGCPGAFHSRCIGVASNTLPKGDWFCPECSAGNLDSTAPILKSFRGADLLGIDIHGRVYFGSCGYLIVCDTCDDCNYYNRNDSGAVIEALMKSVQTSHAIIVSAILRYQSIANDNLQSDSQTGYDCSEGENEGHGFNSVDLSFPQFKADAMPQTKKDDCELHKNSYCQSCLASNLFTLNPVTNDHTADRGKLIVCSKNIVESAHSASIHIPNKDCTQSDDFADRRPSEFCEISEKDNRVLPLKHGNDGPASCQSKTQTFCMQTEANDYINSYSFGHVASSIAKEIAFKPPEVTNVDGASYADNIKVSQLNLISKKLIKLDSSFVQKISLEASKESCGWCFSCKNFDDQECLYLVAEKKFLEPPKNPSVGLCYTKNVKSHITAAAHYVLSIEHNMHGFLTGLWENHLYRKQWQQSVLKATDLCLLKYLLITLESNLRRVTLSAEWLRPVDSDLFLGSAFHLLTDPIHASSKKSGGRKRGRKSLCEAKKNLFDCEFYSSYNAALTSGLCWWRGGKLSRQVFSWKILPRSLAIKSGRQAGCQKIPGIIYSDGSDLAKRSKYIAWRASVEMSKSVAELVFHVKDLHSNIRWNDLENTQIFSYPAKEFKKKARPLKNVMIRSKCMDGKQVNYVLDFGRKKTVPDIVTKHAIMQQETSSGRKKYWLHESVIPLGLLRAFEVRKLEQRAINNKIGKKVLFEEINCKATKRKRSGGFSYLFSKAQKVEAVDYHNCGHCNKDVLDREAVNCQFCGGFLHRKHFRVPKDATPTIYTCSGCKEKSIVKLKPKKHKVQAPVRKNDRRKKILLNKKDQRRKKALTVLTRPLTKRQEALMIKRKKQGKISTKDKQFGWKTEVRTSDRKINKKTEVKIEGAIDGGIKGKNTDEIINSKNCAGKTEVLTYKRKIKKKCEVKIEGTTDGRTKGIESNEMIKRKNFGGKITGKRSARKKKVANKLTSCKRKRSAVQYSYWLNGLLWTRKLDDERAMLFRSQKILIPSMHLTYDLGKPSCSLCHEEYNSESIYIVCEKCGDCIHGAAFTVTLENINNLSGFRCHKCRYTSAPLCPYLKNGNVSSANPHRESDTTEAASADPLLLKLANKSHSVDDTEQGSEISNGETANDCIGEVFKNKSQGNCFKTPTLGFKSPVAVHLDTENKHASQNVEDEILKNDPVLLALNYIGDCKADALPDSKLYIPPGIPNDHSQLNRYETPTMGEAHVENKYACTGTIGEMPVIIQPGTPRDCRAEAILDSNSCLLFTPSAKIQLSHHETPTIGEIHIDDKDACQEIVEELCVMNGPGYVPTKEKEVGSTIDHIKYQVLRYDGSNSENYYSGSVFVESEKLCLEFNGESAVETSAQLIELKDATQKLTPEPKLHDSS